MGLLSEPVCFQCALAATDPEPNSQPLADTIVHMDLQHVYRMRLPARLKHLFSDESISRRCIMALILFVLGSFSLDKVN